MNSTPALNNEQKAAVTYGKGPLLIVAGAGTGKTTVITERIAYLTKNKIKPDEILALTFTDKAAGEMEERVDDLLEYGYPDLWISTFHSFCERILKDHAIDIGLPLNFKILSKANSWLLIRQNFEKFNLNYYRQLGNPTKFIQALISHFSRCKDQEIYPEDYLNYAESLKTRDDSFENVETERIKEVAEAYHIYQRILLENNYFDFGDLINYCLKLFKTRPLILNKYREKFKYILVDEFQDTNWAQYELVKLLAFPENNLTVCADDDQSIYKFRGASFSNIVQFNKDFPNAKQVSLTRNYRSFQNILDLSYKFIKQNDPDRLEFVNKIDKKLVSDKAGEGIIEHIHCNNLEKEAKQVANKIIEILEKDKAHYSDFAILSRSNDGAIPFIKALYRQGIPYQFLASKGLYSKPIILDIISFLKLLDNYHESNALWRVLNFPFLNISQKDIMELARFSSIKAKSLYEAMEESSLILKITEDGRKKISFLLDLIKIHSNMAKTKEAPEVMVSFLEDSGYLKELVKNEKEEELNLLTQFYKKIKDFSEEAIDPSVKNFIEQINIELEAGEEGKLDFNPDEGPDMVKVMTIHGAKGLQFKYVFLVSMVDKRFPSIERKDPIELPEELIKDIKPQGDVHLQEERRICYVAMTRSKKALYFTSSKDYGGAREKKISKFLKEMGFDNNSEFRISNFENDFKKADEIKSEAKKNTLSEYLPDHFSYSQLAAFLKCPLQYKFNFIFKIPVKGKAVFSFGHSIHNTLYEFLKQLNETKNASQKDLFGNNPSFKNNLDFEALLKIYKSKWIEDWFLSKKQKQEYYELGKKIIKEFYNECQSSPPNVYIINGKPALEQEFNLKIKDYRIFGKIDRIDDNNGEAIIIDYKTGKAKEKLEADDKLQLLIYQMACKEVFKIKPKQLVYYYVDEGKKINFLGSDKDIEIQKEKIISEIEEIKKSEFVATPGFHCGFCDFRDICDFRER